jgi:hypothetical protein
MKTFQSQYFVVCSVEWLGFVPAFLLPVNLLYLSALL